MAITLTEASTNITTAVKENRRLYKLRAFLLSPDRRRYYSFYGLQTLNNPSNSPELNRPLAYKHRPLGICPKTFFNFNLNVTFVI